MTQPKKHTFAESDNTIYSPLTMVQFPYRAGEQASIAPWRMHSGPKKTNTEDELILNILTLFDIADRNHIPVVHFPLGHAESVSIEDEDGRQFIGMDLCTFEGARDLKVHFAHELGHCLRGGFYDRDTDPRIRRRCERDADAWAIEHLIPEEELRHRLSVIDPDPADAAEYFGVTEEFLQKAVRHYRKGNWVP